MDSWREVIDGAREARDLLGRKVDLVFALVDHVRAPLGTKLPLPLLIWELNAKEDLWVKLEDVGRFSAWINGDEGRKMLLEVGTFDALLVAIVPLVGLQA